MFVSSLVRLVYTTHTVRRKLDITDWQTKFPEMPKSPGGFSGGIFRIKNGKSPQHFPGGFSGAAMIVTLHSTFKLSTSWKISLYLNRMETRHGRIFKITTASLLNKIKTLELFEDELHVLGRIEGMPYSGF